MRVRLAGIYPADYVGPQACGSCHRTNFNSWERHAHRVMNTAASEDTVRGDFSGVKLVYGPGYRELARRP